MTRLELVQGKIPYIPCKVKHYDRDNFGSCCRRRKHSGASNWIAFLGDSNVRNKALEMLDFLPKNLTYRYFLGDLEVSKEEMYVGLTYHTERPPTFDIFGYIPSDEVSVNSVYIKNGNHDIHVSTNGKNPIASNMSTEAGCKVLSNQSKSSQYTYYSDYLALSDTRTAKFTPERESVIKYNYSNNALTEKDIPTPEYEIRISMVWAPSGWSNLSTIQEWTYGESCPDVLLQQYGNLFQNSLGNALQDLSHGHLSSSLSELEVETEPTVGCSKPSTNKHRSFSMCCCTLYLEEM
ncbi:hypothetical protein SK128_025572 [Halocaridina rubra]|uniref:Uncharacterized protein n=1 Tax=Halocaridina rubra TaxID=373956 RepID=A0AAN8X0J0_HALRR